MTSTDHREPAPLLRTPDEQEAAPPGRTITAVSCRGYGDPRTVLTLGVAPEPSIGDGDLLVDVEAASVNPADWHLVRGVPVLARLQLGLRRPNFEVPGSDFAGRVVRVGPSVGNLAAGDEVFGTTFMHGFGAFATKVAAPAHLVARKPGNLSFAEAAAVPLAAMTALQAVRDHGRVAADDRVLVVGASGGVGTFAVQIARALGADVTGVASTPNLRLVAALGATAVDYRTDRFLDGSVRYDLILELGGSTPARRYRRALTRSGRLVQLSGDGGNRLAGPLGRIVAGQVLSALVPQTASTFTVAPNAADLELLRVQLETGVLTPVIDTIFALDDIHAAFAKVEHGRPRGKVVVAIHAPGSSGRGRQSPPEP